MIVFENILKHPLGQYENDGGDCVACPVGWAQPNQNTKNCVRCGPLNEGTKGKGSHTEERTGQANCLLVSGPNKRVKQN